MSTNCNLMVWYFGESLSVDHLIGNGCIITLFINLQITELLHPLDVYLSA